MLSRIRAALGGGAGERPDNAGHQGRDPEEPRSYLATSGLSRGELLELFIERVTDYRATVHRTTEATLAQTVLEVCHARRAQTLVIPPDLPDAWLPAGPTWLRDVPPNTPNRDSLSNGELSAADGVLSGCALAVAQTGTLVLDGGAAQGRRALSLLPDLHLCVVFARQLVGTVPEAVAALRSAATRPLTLISGPSATSDIELSRVEGVHGPRTLAILLVAPSEGDPS